MKNYLLLIALFLIASCDSTQQEEPKKETPDSAYKQKIESDIDSYTSKNTPTMYTENALGANNLNANKNNLYSTDLSNKEFVHKGSKVTHALAKIITLLPTPKIIVLELKAGFSIKNQVPGLLFEQDWNRKLNYKKLGNRKLYVESVIFYDKRNKPLFAAAKSNVSSFAKSENIAFSLQNENVENVKLKVFDISYITPKMIGYSTFDYNKTKYLNPVQTSDSKKIYKDLTLPVTIPAKQADGTVSGVEIVMAGEAANPNRLNIYEEYSDDKLKIIKRLGYTENDIRKAGWGFFYIARDKFKLENNSYSAKTIYLSASSSSGQSYIQMVPSVQDNSSSLSVCSNATSSSTKIIIPIISRTQYTNFLSIPGFENPEDYIGTRIIGDSTFNSAENTHLRNWFNNKSCSSFIVSFEDLTDGDFDDTLVKIRSTSKIVAAAPVSKKEPTFETKSYDVDFKNVNLTGVNFTNANLKNIDFRGSNLWGAQFYGTDISGANFEGAYYADGAFDFAINKKLANIKNKARTMPVIIPAIENTNINSSYGENCDISNANLSNANFSGSKFNGCIMNNVQIKKSNLTGCNFINAKLKGANFNGSVLVGTNFSNADFHN